MIVWGKRPLKGVITSTPPHLRKAGEEDTLSEFDDLLIDVGYLNTEVMAVEGDALIFHKTIEIGGGNIAADLAIGLDIPLKEAEALTTRRAAPLPPTPSPTPPRKTLRET